MIVVQIVEIIRVILTADENSFYKKWKGWWKIVY